MATTTLNNKTIQLSDDQLNMNLLEFIREELDLTGAKNGCGIGVCGACTILLDGQAIRACRQKVRAIVGHTVVTIEGISGPDEPLHPLQQAFIDHGAIQCGYCTPGMILAGIALFNKTPHPTREHIRKAIAANLCRCTGYQQIVDAMESVGK